MTIPGSVTSIGEAAFSYCYSLAAINVEAANTEYSSDDGVLYNKDKTALHTYPAGKTGSSFSIPGSVTSIGYRAFDDCYSLVSIIIPDSVISIGDFAFMNCSTLTSVTIGSNVTIIGDGAFAYCYSLTGITIPGSVTSIWERAFYYCTSLTSVTFNGTITSDNFSNSAFGDTDYPDSYIGDLRTKYLAGGPGTYTRASGSMTWSKQP